MNHRSLFLGMALILAGAALCHAAPPTPEALGRLAGSPDLSIFVPEPFSTSPPTALRNAVASRLESTTGTVHLNMVVLLAEFYDKRANQAVYTPAHYDSVLFSRGVYPTGSLADYLYENSNGRFILGGVVRGWYLMPHSYDTYVMSVSGRGLYPSNSQGLAEDALKIADPEINFALFDNDGPDGVPDTFDDDQYVDLILVVHAGSGGEASGRTSLQSVAWWLPQVMPVDGVFAQTFAIVPEDGGIGVYGHESLHLLGLPDLYDTNGSSFGLGTWSIMAGGWSLNESKTPAHLDPWCKARLGFLTPVNVSPTLAGAVLDPVEQGGTVYRLAQYGSASSLEYFLVENREKVGFDAYLPGAGLLVYHVNEYNPSNNVPGRYIVALEQADGLFQLENFYGNPSFGDDGDPYTEATPSGGFGRFSVPDSHNQEGTDTGITVYHIHGPDAAGRVTADLRAVKGPTVTLDSLAIVPATGNGDAYLGAGESFAVRPSITVSGATAHAVTLRVASTDAAATLPAVVSLGDLAPGTYQDLPLEVGVAASLPRDPYVLRMSLQIGYTDELPVRRDLAAGIGETRGLASDFENGFAGYTHHPARANEYDFWSQQASGGSAGPHAWRCGMTMGGFYARTDAILESPYFIVPPDGVLKLDQMVEIPRLENNTIVAGAFVEISVNGGNWTEIFPTRGYDFQFFSGDPDLNTRFIFTGDASGPDLPPSWESVVFPLHVPAGSLAVVRFRCFSTMTLSTGQGWWIDNVRVESGSTPVLLAAFSAAPAGGGLRLEWDLTGAADLSGVALSRSPAGAAAFTRLNDALLPPASHGEFIDTAPLTGVSAVYRLEGIGRGGAAFPLGQLVVEPYTGGSPPALLLSAHPNPAAGPVAFEFSLGTAGPARLMVFDAAGRPVREIVSARLDAGRHQYEWNGRDDDGRLVPAGVYFYHLDAARLPAAARTRKLVVVR